jgi:hypothetical protein
MWYYYYENWKVLVAQWGIGGDGTNWRIVMIDTNGIVYFWKKIVVCFAFKVDNKVILWYYYVYCGYANCKQIYMLNWCSGN